MARIKVKQVDKQKKGRASTEMVDEIAAPAERKPVRGVKLKTVSTFTILFAVACLLAFMAGRPPVASGDRLAGRQINREGASTLSNRFRVAKRVYGTDFLSDEAFAMHPYIDKAFYVGLRVGSYELGVVKRTEN
jgi:hypothetical protein